MPGAVMIGRGVRRVLEPRRRRAARKARRRKPERQFREPIYAILLRTYLLVYVISYLESLKHLCVSVYGNLGDPPPYALGSQVGRRDGVLNPCSTTK